MHPRACVSAISTFRLSLAEDLAFWERHGITNVGVSVAKLEALRLGRRERSSSPTRSGADCTSSTSSGSVRSTSPTRRAGRSSRIGSCAPSRPRPRSARSASCSRPDRSRRSRGRRPPTRWSTALAPGAARSAARRRLRDRAHELAARRRRASCTRCSDAIDLARRLDTGVCMELNACWAERALAATIRAGIDRIRLVQVSDFKVGTVASSQRLVPGDGDIPIARILGVVLVAGLRRVSSSSSSSATRSSPRATTPRCRVPSTALGDAARPDSAPDPRAQSGGPHGTAGRRGRGGISRPSISATRSK